MQKPLPGGINQEGSAPQEEYEGAPFILFLPEMAQRVVKNVYKYKIKKEIVDLADRTNIGVFTGQIPLVPVRSFVYASNGSVGVNSCWSRRSKSMPLSRVECHAE